MACLLCCLFDAYAACVVFAMRFPFAGMDAKPGTSRLHNAGMADSVA
jgi:hypothetical protein